MKKRFIAAILCLVMLLGVFAGCNKKNVSSSTSSQAMTVVLALVADEKPTDEARMAVEEALSDITKQLYSIAVKLEVYTPDEYRKVMDAKFAAREKVFSDINDPHYDDTSIADSDSFIINEHGREEVLYPEPYLNQVDILLVNSPEMLREYADEGRLYPLEGNDCMTSTDGEGTLISKNISQSLRNIGMYNESLYAIPGNSIYADYQYLLVDKELYNKYGTTTVADITGLESIQDFLVSVAKKESDVMPLYNITNFGSTSLTDADSVIGQYIDAADQETILTKEFTPQNIFAVSNVKNQISTICAFRDAGGAMPIYTYNVDFSEKFAACYMTGTADIVDKYSDKYHVIPVVMPKTTTDSVYNSMFGVSMYSSDPARAFKVLSLLYTNASFVNTLLYGVEGKNYTTDAEGIVTKLPESGYGLNRYGVGNVFLTTPSTDMTEKERALSANNWKHGKQANADLIITPYLGFDLKFNEMTDFEDSATTKYLVKDIADNAEMLYREVILKIADYTDKLNESTGLPQTFDEFYNNLLKELNSNEYVIAAVAKTDDAALYSFRLQYEAWFNVINPPEDEGEEG